MNSSAIDAVNPDPLRAHIASSAKPRGRIFHSRHLSFNSYIPSGRIGQLNLSDGCYTGYEVFRLAADDLARRGLARSVAAHLRSRRQSVRDFLAEKYGVAMGPREYWHDPRRTPHAADLTDFLRAMRRVRIRR